VCSEKTSDAAARRIVICISSAEWWQSISYSVSIHDIALCFLNPSFCVMLLSEKNCFSEGDSASISAAFSFKLLPGGKCIRAVWYSLCFI
jgi:hypothetical protein